MRWLFLAPTFLVFCIASFCTYTKSLRDSSWYFPITAACSLVCAWLWVQCSRKLDDTNSIIMMSLIWDVLMVVAYYIGPMVFKGDNIGWQAYTAAALTVAGVIWFKMSIS
jgi:hypothetical protein